ncbi:MAG: ATP-binding protein [Terriglobia bacterium]
MSIFRRLFWSAFLPAALTLLVLGISFRVFPRPAGAAPVGEPGRLLVILAVAFVLAVISASIAERGLRRRISSIRSFAQGLVRSREGSGGQRPDGADELGALARELSRAAAEWQGLLERLRLESAHREAILKSMVEGVLAIDNHSRVIFCNDSLARLVGATLPVPTQTSLLDLVRDPGLMEMLSQVLVTREPSKRTLQLSAADGRVFEVQAAPLTEAAHDGALAILHDITGIERLERVRRDFVANVSHELRTPLTAIQGYAESLLDGALENPADARKFVEVILSHAVRLNNIASDLLILSEIESGRKQPEPEPVPASTAIENALHAVEAEARLRGVSLERGEIVEGEILAARVHLEQSLINLLNNAIKFNRPGGKVRVDAVSSGGDQISIVVADDGIGIPSEDLSRIFERFYRVDRARSREVGGTGLGLSIVKHLVERMGGSVKVESRLGEGSTFTMVLPACFSDPTIIYNQTNLVF